MKKAKQEKKKATETNKGIKLPLIQSNTQKGKVKDTQDNSSKAKLFSKESDQKNNLKEIPPMPNIPINKSIPKNKKSFISTHLSQNSNKERGKSEISKKIPNIKEEISSKKSFTKEESSKFTEERLSQLRKQRKQRIMKEKKEEKKEIELYEKLIEEYKGSPKEKKSKNIKNELNEENPKINISSKKAQTILEEGGMLDAYKYVLAQLCKNGLPSGNIFEYDSIFVK